MFFHPVNVRSAVCRNTGQVIPKILGITSSTVVLKYRLYSCVQFVNMVAVWFSGEECQAPCASQSLEKVLCKAT